MPYFLSLAVRDSAAIPACSSTWKADIHWAFLSKFWDPFCLGRTLWCQWTICPNRLSIDWRQNALHNVDLKQGSSASHIQGSWTEDTSPQPSYNLLEPSTSSSWPVRLILPRCFQSTRMHPADGPMVQSGQSMPLKFWEFSLKIGPREVLRRGQASRKFFCFWSCNPKGTFVNTVNNHSGNPRSPACSA